MPRANPFNPILLLDLAQGLDHGDEAGMRTAINRAYYAMHLRSRQGFESRGQSFSIGADVHHDVISSMRRVHRTAGDRLSAMYKARLKADYELGAETPDIQTDLGETLESARYIAAAAAGPWAGLPQ